MNCLTPIFFVLFPAGNWVLFANVHLMQNWMKVLERNLELV
jgi:hypothetical protein